MSQTARSPHGSALNALSGLRPQRHDAPTPRSARSSRDSATVLEQQNDALRKENEEVIYVSFATLFDFCFVNAVLFARCCCS